MSFVQFLAILRARWKMSFFTLLIFIVLAVLVSLFWPKKFTATATVVVDTRMPDPVSGALLPVSNQYLATQVDIIHSDRAARRVIRKMKMLDNPSLHQNWQDATNGEGEFESWVVDLILYYLDVKPSRNSNAIDINYESADPKFAAAIVNQFVQAYIDTNLELRVEPAKQFGSMFSEQLAQARKNMETAQNKLSAFQQQNGMVATDERLDVETARLNELSGQLVAMQASTTEALSRRAQSGVDSPDSMNNGVIMGLRADLARQEAKLQEDLARLGDKHPLIVQDRAGISELRQRILVESGNVGRSSRVSVDIALQRESQTRALLDAQRQKVLKLKAVRDDAQLLVKDVSSAQQAYDAIQERVNRASLESQTTQTNVGVLKYATPPAKPSSPKTILVMLQAIFLGLFVGIGGAILLELRNRRIRVEQDLMELIGVEPLGYMPEANTKTAKVLPIRFAPQLPSKATLQVPSLTQ